jgi:hypothetical protein
MAVFIFSREVEGDLGTRFTQTATVFAGDRGEADSVLARKLGEHAASDEEDSEEDAQFELGPEWRVDEYPLEESQVLTLALNQWPTGVSTLP